jgi:tRNA(Ile)-lysidine synthase
VAAVPPAVAAIRAAVRRALTGLAPQRPVLVACSGGPDSLALAAATAFVAPRLGLRAGLVTVDHGLQVGSARRAAAVAAWAAEAGFTPAETRTVEVAGLPGGPEAAARAARYAALVDAAHRHDASVVLLGHTRDDQAETVLLALARGAGPRGLAGMPTRREIAGVVLVRPLLDVPRAWTREACVALGLKPWSDPHNVDPAYARARVRAEALPALVAALGEQVVANLARSAALIAADNEVLDALARGALAESRTTTGGLAVPALSGLAPAVRTRVLHAWARELGAGGSALSHRHVAALDALVTGWRGQGPVYLPGGVIVQRWDDVLLAANS